MMGFFLLPRMIDEFGYRSFSKEDFLDAFSAYVPAAETSGCRVLNVRAALSALVEAGLVEKEGLSYQISNLGHGFL